MKYIIDTDPGIDDTIAIILGYRNNLDIIGFTLASGNIPIDKSMNNIKIIQDFLGTNIGMYKGTVENKCNKLTAEYAHGKSGLGYMEFPESKRKFERKSAEDFIIKSSKKYKEDLTLVCLGPLTNLANALKKDKNLAKRLKHLVMMGVSYDPKSPAFYPEFNVNVDPEAAKIVLNSGIKDIKIITHELGVKAFIEKEFVESLADNENKVTRFVGFVSKKYLDFSMEHYKIGGMCSPDPVTISSLIKPDLISYKPCHVEVIKVDSKYGTKVTLKEDSNIYISTDINLEEYKKLFKETYK